MTLATSIEGFKARHKNATVGEVMSFEMGYAAAINDVRSIR